MLEGAMTALVTPFKDGNIDLETLETLIEAQIEGGIDAIIPSSSCGI